jgi:hypothetical protein
VSLSDRYNRGDGRIQKFDRYLTDLGNLAGNWWADQTGFSRRTLTQGLYVAAILAASQHGVVFKDPFLLVIAGVAMLSFTGVAGQSKGGVVEQIQAEAAGLPKNTLAVMRLVILFVGTMQLANAAFGFVGLLNSNLSMTRYILDPLLFGIALTALQASDYICRTNPATPGKGGRGKLVKASLSA